VAGRSDTLLAARYRRSEKRGWKVWNVSDAPSLVLGSFFGYAPAGVVLLAL